MSELCAGLAERGWDVTAMPCNRDCRDELKSYPARIVWNGVRIERVWRPQFRQASVPGRLLNAGWMIARWSFAACNPNRRPDVVVIGTDPVLSIMVAPFWRIFRPRTKIVTWCFDLYPEAAYAERVLRPRSVWAGVLRLLLIRAYASCDLIVDIGACMRSLLDSYRAPARHTTLVPWALNEPVAFPAAMPAERSTIFGKARLALLYSGNFGRAHSLDDIVDLARRLRGSGVHLAFSIRGNRARFVRTLRRGGIPPGGGRYSRGDIARGMDRHCRSIEILRRAGRRAACTFLREPEVCHRDLDRTIRVGVGSGPRKWGEYRCGSH